MQNACSWWPMDGDKFQKHLLVALVTGHTCRTPFTPDPLTLTLTLTLALSLTLTLTLPDTLTQTRTRTQTLHASTFTLRPPSPFTLHPSPFTLEFEL